MAMVCPFPERDLINKCRLKRAYEPAESEDGHMDPRRPALASWGEQSESVSR